jgi:hypothetical protein
MTRPATHKFSANEEEIAQLLKENQDWKNHLSYTAEEISFLEKLLAADIFQKNILNLYEKLQIYSSSLESFRTDNLDLIKEIHNNHNDIEGMRECEDIGCEIFYHEEHLKLVQRVKNFLEQFKKFKLEVFSYTAGLLKKSSKEF